MPIQSFCLAIFLFCVSALWAQVQQVEVVRGTAVDGLVMASTDRLPTQTMFREVHLKVPVPRGANLNCVLLLAHDTQSRRSWWFLGNAGDQKLTLTLANWFVSHSATFVADDKMVVFWSDDPGRLSLIERRGFAAGTMEEAQQIAIEEIRSRAGVIDKGGEWLGLGGTSVPLPQARISTMFWNPPDQAGLVDGLTKVVSVSRNGENWKLVLRNQWDQEVVLDDSYNFVSTRRLDTPTASGAGQH